MLPARLLCFAELGDELIPRLLTVADHPWLAALLEEHARYAGRPWGELRIRMGEPLPCPSPLAQRRAAWHVLERLGSRRPSIAAAKPRELRLATFLAAQAGRQAEPAPSRQDVLASVAPAFELSVDELERGLFADHPDERLVELADPWPDPATLALQVNLALVQGILLRALWVKIRLRGQARAVVRQAQLRRLLCTVTRDDEVCLLELSGAYTLFRRTLLYGRRLASLVPALQHCQRFELEARCLLKGRELTMKLATGAPVFPGRAPKRFDSKLEERFARDFSKLTRDWDLLREPEPLQAGRALIFPDFELRHRREKKRRWLLEIVGFWTPDYLQRKLRLVRRCRVRNLLLCIDQELNLGEQGLPGELPVLWYRRRVDAQAVLDFVERAAPARPEPPTPSLRSRRLGARELFLDYAGRRPAGHPIHGRLARLRAGSVLRLVPRSNRVLLADERGGEVAALSKKGAQRLLPRQDRIAAIEVSAVLERSSQQSAPGYRGALRVERWLVPVVEVFWLAG